MLKLFLLLSTATAIVLFGIAPATTSVMAADGVPQDAVPHSSGTAPKTTPALLGRAKKLYSVDCSMCHGDNGNGKTDLAKDMGLSLSDWTDPKALTGKSDQEIFDLIRSGKDKMPPEGDGRAKNDDVWGLIAYIRGFSKNQPAAPDKAAN